MINRGVLTALARCLGEIGRGLWTATALVGFALGVTGRFLRSATSHGGSVRDTLLVGRRGGRRDRSRSRDPPRRSRGTEAVPPLSSDRSRSDDRGRRARRELQEGETTVTVSQAPVVSEAAVAVTPPDVGSTVAALPSAVQDLARFFLSLTGSSSQGAVGSVAGAAVSASGVSAPGAEAVASCAATAPSAVAERRPSASAAVPGSSCRQQREEELSRRSRRRRRSSSGGTGRASKRRPRDRSPSLGRSYHHQGESYRSSSSEGDRAESPPPSSGRALGGTPGDSRPAPAGDHSPRPGPSGWRPRSSAVAERYRPGFGGHLSPPLLRVRQTMTAVLPSTLWTSTGMTPSGQSWPSSGASTTWKSR